MPVAIVRRLRSALCVVGLLCVVVATLLVVSSLTPQGASAHVMRQHLTRFPLQPNVTILYDTRSEHADPSTYTSRVRFVMVGESSVRYDWATYSEQHLSQATRGVSMVRDLNTCKSLDPWWPVRDAQPQQLAERCELWLSREVFRDLKAHGRAQFAPDQHHRGDLAVEFKVEEYTRLTINIDGVPRALPAIEVVPEDAQSGDRFWILDSESNPFVLKSRIRGQYSWRVTDIFVNTSPPSIPMYP